MNDIQSAWTSCCFGVCLVLVACQTVSPPNPMAPTSQPVLAPAVTSTPLSPFAPTPVAALTPLMTRLPTDMNAELTDLALDDLARRLNVPRVRIQVESMTADEFPLQNLGCPSPESTPNAVQPALVSAWEIRLRVDEQFYIYRGRGRQLVYCGKG